MNSGKLAGASRYLRAGIANLGNSEGGGISIEGGILDFRLRGEVIPLSKNPEVRFLAYLSLTLKFN